ncbi:MAG: DUF6011 domain-containing protein [Saprospiraceae bacterium]
MTNPRARIISRLYYESPSDLSNVAEAHKIATKTLNRYGPYKLKYVITLQPLPFKAFDAIPIFTELDRKHGASPIIRILHTNINGEYEELEIAFYINPDSTADRKRLQVTNLTTKQALMQIERSGHVIPEADAREIVPILQLFMPFSKDTKSLIISYGLETGTCGICGRTLTDEASIRRGVGPICASGRGWAD